MIRIYHHIWSGGTGLEIAELQKARIYNKIKDEFIYYPNVVSIEQNENYTLLKMLEELERYDGEDYLLYFHTKGASKGDLLYAQQWREFMESSLIDDYKSHIDMLDWGFTTSGVLHGIPLLSEYIYPGNFWWSKVKFLKTFPKEELIKKESLEFRWYAEWHFIQQLHNWKPGNVKHTPTENFECFYDFLCTLILQNNFHKKTGLFKKIKQ
jgi:hypothetical protein